MLRRVLALIFALAFGCGCGVAQSIDLSKPMTGKSTFAIDTDGSPAELGVRQGSENAPLIAPGGIFGIGSEGDTVGLGSSGGGVGTTPGGERTVHVNSYTRKDGTTVRSHSRSAPRGGGGGGRRR